MLVHNVKCSHLEAKPKKYLKTFYIVNQHLCWYTFIHTHPHLKLDYEISHSVHTAFWCSTPFHSLNNASYNLPNQSLCPPGEPGSGPCQAFHVGLSLTLCWDVSGQAWGREQIPELLGVWVLFSIKSSPGRVRGRLLCMVW